MFVMALGVCLMTGAANASAFSMADEWSASGDWFDREIFVVAKERKRKAFKPQPRALAPKPKLNEEKVFSSVYVPSCCLPDEFRAN
ncbi:hypothetical protein MAIT1_01010 [Magnetofaba australis IT-1]|uniref:Secreted protein n=1 Tax=Magnetofaba australis IT-1 TaxID=1434232 RepID=A0A1Y2JZZ0_9PROT|nr:hypothetical protein MAIT1_01010 [Magnetofaba australis IT-1]